MSIRAVPRKAFKTASFLLHKNPIAMAWASGGAVGTNWGDKLNPYLIEKFTGHRPYHKRDLYPLGNFKVHYWVGSHLKYACNDSKSIVFGAGFIHSNDIPNLKPYQICAVRGWLSFEKIISAGIECPEVVGDAALLMPFLYKPKKIQRKVLGIIPHYKEQDLDFFRKVSTWPDTRIINIMDPIEKVIDEIGSCDTIASSSLHGIICADAYGVPSVWIHASDRLLGDGFKFRDYFSASGRTKVTPLMVSVETKHSELENSVYSGKIQVDVNKLLSSCPIKINHKVFEHD